MNRQISLAQYRTIDLTILTVVMAFSQGLIYFASSQWFPEQMYVVSSAAGIVAIVMMRWGAWGAIEALLSGIVFVLFSRGTWEHYLIYGVGNLLSVLALVMFRIFTKERIRKSAFLSVVFALCVQLLMQLGRAGVAALLGQSAGACLGFITTDILSEIFTAFIVWVARRVEGLFEDQKNYLLRIQSEAKS